MKNFRSKKNISTGKALVPVGARVDHAENPKTRKQRELGAAFNRMSSVNETEAHNAFERARDITRDIGISFDAIWRASRANATLEETNKKLAQQLKLVMQENARFRSMNLSYQFKGVLIQAGRIGYRSFMAFLPVLIVGVLFLLGYISFASMSLLLLPIGFYSASRGVLTDSPRRISFGVVLLLLGIVGTAVGADHDAPEVRRHEIALLENMNRDHELGPKTLRLDYPYSRMTRVATVYGIRDTIKFTIDGASDPIEISCAKYYDNAVIARRSLGQKTPEPDKPDIFHSIPVATFGACDLYAKLAAIH